ncbi:pectinesterase family protein [Dyella acidisoli]|uniref:Pectinesterase n=1 Tax=Dyella acidisoli TaxID=1867834 RepID=A0ABQ5XM28_9GAMM|nr:pectinesterase family protein [Dyella acidisoli]GLQ91626.1 hypothetical protein GCM10007901_05760 [Dyella acidisoli]
MKYPFKRKRSALLVAQALAVLMASATLPTHAQSAGQYKLTDSATRTTLINLLSFRLPNGTTRISDYDSAPVIVAAHRGAVNRAHPENTVESAVNTLNAGIESMELDVYETSDHVPYLMHDKTLYRMLNRPEYSDIYRWARENGAANLRTPAWSDIENDSICTGEDGYGQTVNSPFCNDGTVMPHINPATLEQALYELYQDSYEGLVFLDLREWQNVRDVAAIMSHDLAVGDGYGVWEAKHVVLKFQTALFAGPEDFYEKTAAYYQSLYNASLTQSALAQLYVMPTYTSNGVANQDTNGNTTWARTDYQNWLVWNLRNNNGNVYNVLSPLVGLKAFGASLNYGSDDLYTALWQSGRNMGVYIPETLCTMTNPSTAKSNLFGANGTYWEGGICGPLAPAMNANECGTASTTTFDLTGQGCTDHRPFAQFWHDKARFGFIITDKPIETLDYLMQFPGQRPGSACPGSVGTCHITVTPPPVLIVAADGSGNYKTINAAVAAMPASGGVIEIKPGTYHEKITITKPSVSLIGLGQDASQVLITHDDYAAKINPATGKAMSTSGSYTLAVSGNDFYASNLTIQNTADYEAPNFENNSQAVALYTTADRAVFRAVMLEGGQDTLYVGNDKRAYFNNCYVEGYVDYIFGNGKAVFDSCLIKTKIHGNLSGEATITAQSKASAGEDSGFVFLNSQLLFDSPYMTNAWLGRPWGAYATTYFVNTKMGSQIEPAGWIEFIPAAFAPPGQGTNNLPTSTYREYNSFYPGANGNWTVFNLSQRESTSPNSNIALSSNDAANLQPDIYLAGSDKWAPTKVFYGGDHSNQALPIPTPAPGVPTAPTITSNVAGNGNVQVSWAGQPASPVEQGYTITATQNGKTFGPITLPPYASTGYIDGLANGTPATVTVREFNAQGSSAPSASIQVTPVAHDPSAPTNIQTSTSSTSATVTLTIQNQGIQPVFGGSVAHAGIYTSLYASRSDAYAGKALAGTSAGLTTNSWTFTNLRPNTTYWMSLAAYNGYYSPTVIASFTTKP